jgi:Na+-transporting methylmalonyl-CoA/oxaloacetate decarboxylase gamma subunit
MLVAALIMFVVLILILALVLISFGAALPNEVGEKQATHPTTTQEAARNQQPQHSVMLVAALLVALVLIFALVFIRFCVPLPKAGEQQTAHPATAQETTGNQQAHQSTILPATLFVFVVLILILVFIRFGAPFPDEAGEQQTTQPTTTQEAARNQQPQHSAMLVAALLVFVVPFTAFAQQMGKKQVPHTSSAQHSAADNQAGQLPLIRATLILDAGSGSSWLAQKSVGCHHILLCCRPIPRLGSRGQMLSADNDLSFSLGPPLSPGLSPGLRPFVQSPMPRLPCPRRRV